MLLFVVSIQIDPLDLMSELFLKENERELNKFKEALIFMCPILI